MRAPRVRNGVMSVQIVCLGWHWSPYQYSRTADDIDGAAVPPMPEWLAAMGVDAVAATMPAALVVGAHAQPYAPDAALINYYRSDATMGMHRDSDEIVDAPVVSISFGMAGLFRFGNAESRGRPYHDIVLRSGDLLVFGGPARHCYHGVPRLMPSIPSPDIGLETGRLNITLRMTGLTG